MISRLTGTVIEIRPLHIILDVHGVGYRIAVRSTVDFSEGSNASLHTYLAVRENALDLYGFTHHDELAMFEELIKLPKIGPKSAMQILMQAEVSMLKKAVNDQDPVYLTKISGIGKKTAEKIVSELKDTFFDESDLVGSVHTGSDADVVDALLTLGYSQKEVRDVVQKLSPEIEGTKARITEALRHINR